MMKTIFNTIKEGLGDLYQEEMFPSMMAGLAILIIIGCLIIF